MNISHVKRCIRIFHFKNFCSCQHQLPGLKDAASAANSGCPRSRSVAKRSTEAPASIVATRTTSPELMGGWVDAMNQCRSYDFCIFLQLPSIYVLLAVHVD